MLMHPIEAAFICGAMAAELGLNEKLTTALLDRLTHHSHILTTRRESYRSRKLIDGDHPSHNGQLTPAANPQKITAPAAAKIGGGKKDTLREA